MKAALIVVTLVELALLVVVLAVYLLVIARQLRVVSRTLGLITFGVRAIEKQTEPLGPVLGDINAALQQVNELLDEVGRTVESERTVEAVEHMTKPGTPGG